MNMSSKTLSIRIMYRLLVYNAVIALFCISCKTNVEQRLTGFWTIDVLDAPGLSEGFLTNIISFKKDGNCLLPNNGNGTWIINEKDSTLNIIAVDNPLEGTYNFTFLKDDKDKLLKLILNSKKKEIKMICSKGLFNFDRDKNF